MLILPEGVRGSKRKKMRCEDIVLVQKRQEAEKSAFSADEKRGKRTSSLRNKSRNSVIKRSFSEGPKRIRIEETERMQRDS